VAIRVGHLDRLRRDGDAAWHGNLRQRLIGWLGIVQKAQDERPCQREGRELARLLDDAAVVGRHLRDFTKQLLQRRADVGKNLHEKLLLLIADCR
jgi:hypothetical protein